MGRAGQGTAAPPHGVGGHCVCAGHVLCHLILCAHLAEGGKQFRLQSELTPTSRTLAYRAHLDAIATWNGSAPESIEYKMMPRDQTSALAASYPLSSVAIRTSGAAYMSDPHFVC